MSARNVCSGTRPSRYHSERLISAPPSRPPTWTRMPFAPARIAVCTPRRIARRNETRPTSCSAIPCATSGASSSGCLISNTFSWMLSLCVMFFRSSRMRSTSAPPDHDARTRGVDVDLDAVFTLTFDVDARDAGVGQRLLDVLANANVFLKPRLIRLVCVPARMPLVVRVRAEAEAVRVDLVTHYASLGSTQMVM